jgi:glycerol-3-phosphate dehydrogenase
MTRDPDRFGGRTFDVAVVGGGIYGLIVACDASQRGLSVALIERDDFGCGSSFNHLRTIHGGLRYLQSLDVRRARESVRERRTIARIAPHTVKPLPFALPLYRSLTRGKLAMRAGFLLDRFISIGRNAGVPESHRLPGGSVVGKSSAIQQFPGLRRQGLIGAAVWYDYVTLEPDRLTLSWALAAHANGAVVANHLEATALVKEGSRIVGVRGRDCIDGRPVELSARVVVNATGGAVDTLLATVGTSSGVPMLKAMNLVTRRDAGDEALGGRSASGRNLFMVPWRGRALFGTWESAQTCDATADCRISEQEVAAFIGELNHAFPNLELTLADITLVHQGVVPALVDGRRVTLEGRDQIRDHAADRSDAVDGLVSVPGTKYTTARAVAERVTDLVLTKLQRAPVPSQTATTTLPGGSVGDIGYAIAAARREHDDGLPSDCMPHLIAAYGSRYQEVLELTAGRPELKKRVVKGLPVIGAELLFAAKHEMAITLADALIRRTPAGALGYPGDEAVDRAADIVAAERRWSDERKRAEAAAVRAFYGTVNALNT